MQVISNINITKILYYNYMKLSSPVKKKRQLPIFDFLKTTSVPSTPQPAEVKTKKMFLTLYKTLKHEKKITTEDKKTEQKFHVKAYRQRAAMMIEGLIPIPTSCRSNKKRTCSPKRSMERPIKVRVYSRRATPVLSKFDFDLSEL